MKTALVIPTNRPDSLRRFLKEWNGKGGWDAVIVVEDAPECSPMLISCLGTVLSSRFQHYSHAEIGEILGDRAWIISQEDSACRCFGFLAAYWQGFDYVLTTDDDCYPVPEPSGLEPPSLVEMHRCGGIQGHGKWVSSVAGLTVRGLPQIRMLDRSAHLSSVAVNIGLWMGVPDQDAQSQLENPIVDFQPPRGSRLIPHGQYVPTSGMNLFLKREALPLFYFPLQGKGQPYRRYDDIWAGVIAKHIMDYLGWQISVGEPFVRHERASDPHVNLVKEAPGKEFHDTFWRTIDRISLVGLETPFGCLDRIGRVLSLGKDAYLRQVGKALLVWSGLFRFPPEHLAVTAPEEQQEVKT